MKLVGLSLMLLVATTCHAQVTQSPLKAECGKKCQGSYILRNEGVKPANFDITVSTMHLSSAANGPVFTPLDNATVKLSQSGGRLGPKETRQIDYKIQCTALPCQVSFINAVQAIGQKGGVGIRVATMFTVYSCDKERGCRETAMKAAGLIAPENKK